MILLFPGVPGGPELLVVLLLLVALFGVPVVVAVLGWRYLKGDRVEDLEARVEELESELGGVDSRSAEGADVTTTDADDDRPE